MILTALPGWAIGSLFVCLILGLFILMVWDSGRRVGRLVRLEALKGKLWYREERHLYEGILHIIGGLPGVMKALHTTDKKTEWREFERKTPKTPGCLQREWTINDVLSMLGFTFSWQVDDKQDKNLLVATLTEQPGTTDGHRQWILSTRLSSNPDALTLFVGALDWYNRSDWYLRWQVRGGTGPYLPPTLEAVKEMNAQLQK